jgi:hypothetical protein
VRPIGTAIEVAGDRDAVQRIQQASKLLPDDWTAASAKAGKFDAVTVNGRSGVASDNGHSTMYLGRESKDDVVLHELMHRIQHVNPALDDLFADLHRRRTAGDKLKKLAELEPHSGYRQNELTREDKYVNPYFGKEYAGHSGRRGGPLEMITMAIQMALGDPNGASLQRLAVMDPEMLELVLSVLWYAP